MIITLGIAMMFLLAFTFVLFFYFSQQKFQDQRMMAQQTEIDHQKQLLFNSIQVQESERQRLARELHDEVGSKLNVINMGLHRMRKAAESLPAINDTLQNIFSVVDTTIFTTRRIAHDLLPPTLLNFGLTTALEELCEQHRMTTDFTLDFELRSLQPIVLEPNTSLQLFRVAQELLSNTIKHAQASKIKISLWQNEQEIGMDYNDNGKGFSMDNPEQQKGMGMQNIESRMGMINASYTLKSETGKGIFFQASIKRT